MYYGGMNTKPAEPKPPKIRAEVAANVRAQAARAERTQIQISRFLDIDPGTVNRRWSARAPWSVADLVQLSAFFGCDLAELLALPKDKA